MTSVTSGGAPDHKSAEFGGSERIDAHNVGMARRIEPGLLRVFRFFVGIRLGVLALIAMSLNDRPADELLLVPQPGLFVYTLLLVYLLAPQVERWMGKWFLPVGITVAAASPIIENGIAVAMRLEQGATPNEAIGDYWLLFFVLFVPLILVAWQFRFRAVLLYAVGTTILDAIVISPLLQEEATQAPIVGGLLVGRGGVFALVGYVIIKLVQAQRLQQQELIHYAATREQLATSNERARLARELHDTLAHTLSAVAVQLEGATSLWDDDPERAHLMVDRSLASTRTGLAEARRAIQALRASPLEDLGLTAAVRQLAIDAGETHGIEVDTAAVEDVGTVRPEVEHTIYRITEEALTNSVRHGRPTVMAVALGLEDAHVILEVTDNGSGFDTAASVPEGHQGIHGMRERAGLVNGELTIATNQNGGTTVTFEAAP